MANILATILIDADDSPVQRAQKSVKGLKEEGGRASTAISGISKGMVGIGAAIGTVTLAVSAMNKLAAAGMAAATAGDLIGKTSKSLGLTAERYQELSIVAGDAGISQDEFNESYKTFTERVAEAAKGTGEAANEFKALGVNVMDTEGNVRDLEELFWETGRATVALGDDTLALGSAQKTMGGQGYKNIEMFKQTEEQVDALIGKAYDYSAIMSNEMVAAAEAYKSELDLITAGNEQLALQRDMILAPLSKEWALIKNEIAFATINLLEFFGMIDATVLTTQRRIDGIKGRLEELGEPNQAQGRNKAANAKEWNRLQAQLAEEQAVLDELKAKQQAETDAKEAEYMARQEKRLEQNISARKAYLAEMEKLMGGAGGKGGTGNKPEKEVDPDDVVENGFSLNMIGGSTGGDVKDSLIVQTEEEIAVREKLRQKEKELNDERLADEKAIADARLAFADQALTAMVGYFSATGSGSEDMKNQYLQQVKEMMIKALLFNAIAGLSGGKLSVSGGGFGGLEMTGAEPHFKGAVFNGKQMYAPGHTIAERGPEIVAPAKYNSNGELGVSVAGLEGGGQTINISQSITVTSENADPVAVAKQVQAVARKEAEAVYNKKSSRVGGRV